MQDPCRRYQEHFGTGPMPDDLARHARNCPSCQEFTRRQETLRQALSVWKAPAVTGDFALSVMSRLAETHPRKPGLRQRLSQWLDTRWSIPVPVGALAMALLLVSLFFNAYLYFQPQTTGPNPGPVIVNNPGLLPTPLAETGNNPSLTSFGSQWTGTGAFLLIPLMDLQSPMPSGISNSESDQNSQNI